jgi:Xaa-Pro aminopeptidase
MVPISTKLVNVLMMSREEINWLNTYHSKVREKLFPLLDETEKKWLVQATEAIAIN